jgi:DNA-binding MarR family transcriptional regulator
MTHSDMAPGSQVPGTQTLGTSAPDSPGPDSPAPDSPGAEHACAQAWAALTAAHALVSGQLSTALARACDLSINDFQILLRLDRVPTPGLRLTELNSAIALTQPSLSRAVARLGQRGWLSRTGTEADRRGILITITPAGRDVLGQAIPVHAQTIREFLLDALTPDELDLLARALSRVAEADTTLKSR